MEPNVFCVEHNISGVCGVFFSPFDRKKIAALVQISLHPSSEFLHVWIIDDVDAVSFL